MKNITVEHIGLVPRSIITTFNRFIKQLSPATQQLMIQEFRISRYQFLVSIKCLVSLIFIPLLINWLLKNYLLLSFMETVWNKYQSELFLNSYIQKQAFRDLKNFQEKLYFDYLVNDSENLKNIDFSLTSELNDAGLTRLTDNNCCISYTQENTAIYTSEFEKNLFYNHYIQNMGFLDMAKFSDYNLTTKDIHINMLNFSKEYKISEYTIKKLMQKKILQLAVYYNHQSIVALTNLYSDVITFLILTLLIKCMEAQIIILKSVLLEAIYSLNDANKCFFLILITNLLVGFHSPRGWEIFFEFVLRHLGFPENQSLVFLFVASFPVVLATIIKYWIFRYLNKISPTTVATYHRMIE